MDLLLGRLVSMCSQTLDGTTVRMVSTLFNVASAELSDPPNQILQSAKLQMILPPLHNICATAECELEAHWAAKIWQSGDPWKCLEQFPYLDNYSELTRIEMCSIHAVNPSPIRSVAFIGSGPLPLTSLALLKKLRHPSLPLFAVDSVTNIDISRDAINASQAMARRLGLDCDKMRFQLADAADPALDLKRYDVVYLAALVGESQAQKENLLASVACRMRPEATLVTRSCHGLKTVLYQVRGLCCHPLCMLTLRRSLTCSRLICWTISTSVWWCTHTVQSLILSSLPPSNANELITKAA